MTDVFKIIENLKVNLMKKYGNVLLKEYSQDEVHMTYYAGDILERQGHKYVVSDGVTMYTEKAMQDAFVAGLRVGKRDAQGIADNIVEGRMAEAINRLMGIGYD